MKRSFRTKKRNQAKPHRFARMLFGWFGPMLVVLLLWVNWLNTQRAQQHAIAFWNHAHSGSVTTHGQIVAREGRREDLTRRYYVTYTFVPQAAEGAQQALTVQREVHPAIYGDLGVGSTVVVWYRPDNLDLSNIEGNQLDTQVVTIQFIVAGIMTVVMLGWMAWSQGVWPRVSGAQSYD